MRNLLKHTFSTYLGISSILIFSLQVSAQDERSNATNILSYYNNSFPLVKVKKILQHSFDLLYKEGINEVGDESDIDVDKKASAVQMMAELLAKKPKWRNLFSPVVQGIEWDMVNGYPITLEDYKKGKSLYYKAYHVGGKSRLVGFPKFKKRFTIQLGKGYVMGGDTGTAAISASTKDQKYIDEIGFRSFFACESPDVCEKYMNKQFNKKIKITPITNYCHDFIHEDRDTLGFIMNRFYKLDFDNKQVFMSIYANQDDGGAATSIDGYTDITLYRNIPNDDIENSKCLLLRSKKGD
jgi:hypothetical protein